jgi:hypothetical protein
MRTSATIAAAGIATFLLGLAACRPSVRPQTTKPSPVTSAIPRLKLDPEASPLAFRWLADDAVLVSPDVGQRKLAGLGNYVDRAAQKVERARLSVWDDEAAWKTATSEGSQVTEAVAHKRAVYLKDPSPPDPVERFLVFGRDGTVVYERDFRSYPLTELD